ncbi:MAG: hypothetical protein QGH19_03300 [Candidatus Woesearchaeota archaeon]|jgi:hypothetical protein|nr:hypothetical protein [Candidatus Woesearchaeota archaeon]MDP7610767.1 hypothetical protein [Candidatus Woesearchaeota archaeon]|tara:strand:- start:666 stop:1517 length:852 start_codon:yes stop_codon:yes gene_type:complete
MNNKICKKLLKNKEKFVPYLFTDKQIKVISKHINNKPMTNTEKVYLYSSIKRKIDALSLLKEEFYFYGTNMIQERLKKAKELLKEINDKAFISGSFLFSKNYNDIDLYIISNRRKQYHKGKMHFIYITEEDLKKPIFQSAAKYCVSNFEITMDKPIRKRMKFNDLIVNYETTIVELLDKEDEKTIREVLFEYYIQLKNTILSSYEIYTKTINIINTSKSINILNNMVKELLLKNYSKRYIYDELSNFVKRLDGDIKEFKANENLKIYRTLFNEVKNECRRAAA